MLASRWFTIVAAAAAPVASFFITLWLRDDVTRALGLSATAARHVKIETLAQCERGEVVVVVAIDKGGVYAPVKFDRCP